MELEEAKKILSDGKILFQIQRDTALSIRVAIETLLNKLEHKDKVINDMADCIAYGGKIHGGNPEKVIEYFEKKAEASI